MPVANVVSSKSSRHHQFGANLAYDANRRRMVHGPLQPMDADVPAARQWARSVWLRLFRS